MKTIESLKLEANMKMDLWERVTNDPQAIIDRGTTKEQAMLRFEYFMGQYDGICAVDNLEED